MNSHSFSTAAAGIMADAKAFEARADEAESRIQALTLQIQNLESISKKIKQLEAEKAALAAENSSLKSRLSSNAGSAPAVASSSPSSSSSSSVVVEDIKAEGGPITLRTRVSLLKLFQNEKVYVGKEIGVGGWIRTARLGGGGKFAFIKVYDGTTSQELQLVMDSTLENFSRATQTGAAIFAIGEVKASVGKEQSVEMSVKSLEILGECDPTNYPLAGKALPLSYLREQAHLRIRTAAMGGVMRIRNTLAFATHEYFNKNGFQYVHTPLITASDCEGGGQMFHLTTLVEDGEVKERTKEGKIDYSKDFFRKPAYLTVSGQLNVETYAVGGLSNVYTFGPTFRAENSHTSRHLAEFWMIEPEIAFADIKENMDCAEGYVKFVIQALLERNGADLEILEQLEKRNAPERKKQLDIEKQESDKRKAVRAAERAKQGLPKKKKVKSGKKDWKETPLRQRLGAVLTGFARVTYTEAIEILQKAIKEGNVEFDDEDIKWGMDLASEHERYLCEEHFAKPTIVINYPAAIKAFYMRMNEDGKTVAAMDILVPGIGELVGGSQREERLENLLARMKDMHLKEEDYSWYLDLRRFGGVPHAGFGLGFERLVCYATGMDNIRDVIPFPRYPGHADF